jgi:hypothetical protein
VRDGCTAKACGAFALLNDTSRISANLAERTYEAYVVRYSAEWPGAKETGAAAAAAAPARGAGLFFPSAASIPPVNIMDAEPKAPETTSTTPAAKQTPTPRPARRPAQSSGSPQSAGGGQSNPRQPVDLNAAARSAPPAAPQ